MNEVENYHVCSSGYNALRRGELNLGAFPGLLKKIIENDMWKRRQLPSGKIIELGSIVELITLPLPDGWGESVDNIEALLKSVKDEEAVEMFRRAKKHQGKRKDLANFGNNITEVPKRITGTSLPYTLARLKRNHRDLYNQVSEGKLSANAAAVKAGFRKKPTPYEIVIKQLDKLTAKELEEVRETISVLFLAM